MNDDKKKASDKGEEKVVDIGGIVVNIGDSDDTRAPSPKDLEKELLDGGIEVVEGKKSPDDDIPVS